MQKQKNQKQIFRHRTAGKAAGERHLLHSQMGTEYTRVPNAYHSAAAYISGGVNAAWHEDRDAALCKTAEDFWFWDFLLTVQH